MLRQTASGTMQDESNSDKSQSATTEDHSHISHEASDCLGKTAKGLHVLGAHLPKSLLVCEFIAETTSEILHNPSASTTEKIVCGTLTGVVKYGVSNVLTGLVAVPAGLASTLATKNPAAGIAAATAVGSAVHDSVNTLVNPLAHVVKSACHAGFQALDEPVDFTLSSQNSSTSIQSAIASLPKLNRSNPAISIVASHSMVTALTKPSVTASVLKKSAVQAAPARSALLASKIAKSAKVAAVDTNLLREKQQTVLNLKAAKKKSVAKSAIVKPLQPVMPTPQHTPQNNQSSIKLSAGVRLSLSGDPKKIVKQLKNDARDIIKSVKNFISPGSYCGSFEIYGYP